MRVHGSLVVVWVLGLGIAQAVAERAFFGVGDLPSGTHRSWAEGVSGDGSVVIGSTFVRAPNDAWTVTMAFRWTRTGGIEPLVSLTEPNSGPPQACFPNGVSRDGSVIVGHTGNGAFRWTAATGLVAIPNPASPPLTSYCDATGVSADGSVVVGASSSSDGTYRGWRWTADGGTQTIGSLPGAIEHSGAFGVSPDGSVVVGMARNAQHADEAFLWTASEGMVGLGFLNLPGEEHGSEATAVSADGRTIVGDSTGFPANTSVGAINEPFRWTAEAGMVSFGVLPGGEQEHFGVANAVSGDGSIVVGESYTGSGSTAFIWDARHGMRRLQDVLTGDLGLNLDGWNVLSATGISDDGRTIVGYGVNPYGQPEGWVAVVPEPATGTVMGLAVIFVMRSGRRRK